MRDSKIPILITGSSGLIASHLLNFFSDKYEFDKLDISDTLQPVDITNLSQLKKAVFSSKAKHLVHFAAFTNVSQAWQETGDKNSLSYKINVIGTKNVAQVSQEFEKHLIHISTAYVFDGQKNKPYLETDQPKPIEWYGQTKREAEQIVMATKNWTVLRIDQPFGSLNHPKLDILHKIVKNLKQNTLPPQFSNHHFGPTFIDDFVKVIEWAIRTKATGIFHASSGEIWTDFQFAQTIQESIGSKNIVSAGDLNQYLKTINRPYQSNTALDCSKLKNKLDFKFTSIKRAIKLVAENILD